MIELLGDANNDGKITLIDAIIALNISANFLPYNKRVDLNADGSVTLLEARDILKHLQGTTLIKGVVE